MNELQERLAWRGISRRGFLKYCTMLASLMALPPAAGQAMAEALARARRPAVIWLPFQECTGCLESITRSHTPTIEGLIFDALSLDYSETLMAAAGHQAEQALKRAVEDNAGRFILVIDGSVPTGLNGAYSCIAGRSNLDLLREVAPKAAVVIAMGSCAAFGGIPAARPNPTGAVAISEIVRDKPLVNIPGCPPIPVVMTGVIAHYLTFGSLPELDRLRRPRAFYGETIHDRCYRRPFYDRGLFAKRFDDEGARQGWCLFELGCKGPVTYNACAHVKWNDHTSFPIESGHGCIGCSEPGFWDAGGFYRPLSAPAGPLKLAAGAVAAGAAVGVAVAIANRARKGAARAAHVTATVADLEKADGGER
ncbi:MAG: hydrogenase small subunit [Thiobacillaceae bacterium]|nr:hydrogenase small subunit [Thiobacillaceae bacterium]